MPGCIGSPPSVPTADGKHCCPRHTCQGRRISASCAGVDLARPDYPWTGPQREEGIEADGEEGVEADGEGEGERHNPAPTVVGTLSLPWRTEVAILFPAPFPVVFLAAGSPPRAQPRGEARAAGMKLASASDSKLGWLLATCELQRSCGGIGSTWRSNVRSELLLARPRKLREPLLSQLTIRVNGSFVV